MIISKPVENGELTPLMLFAADDMTLGLLRVRQS